MVPLIKSQIAFRYSPGIAVIRKPGNSFFAYTRWYIRTGISFLDSEIHSDVERYGGASMKKKREKRMTGKRNAAREREGEREGGSKMGKEKEIAG